MKKFRDYFLKAYNENTGYSLEGPPVCVSNIDTPFAMAKADGVKTLEVSKWEYTCLARFYQVPWNWSGKTIWGIRLVIKEPSTPKITERILSAIQKADEQMWTVKKIELGKKEFEELIEETRGLGGCGEIFGVKIERAILEDSYFQIFYSKEKCPNSPHQWGLV